MTSLIIGISLGVFTILLFEMLKGFDKAVVYGLILTGIGFLYVGYTWSDLASLIINITQAVIFLGLAYYGVKKSITILAVGYLLHGIWDFGYELLNQPDLLPPHYDLFCLSVDFTIGLYLLLFARHIKSKYKTSI